LTCNHKYKTLRVYRNPSSGAVHRYYQCDKCEHKYTGIEVPKHEYAAFQRFRALVRTHPEDYFDSDDVDSDAISYSMAGLD